MNKQPKRLSTSSIKDDDDDDDDDNLQNSLSCQQQSQGLASVSLSKSSSTPPPPPPPKVVAVVVQLPQHDKDRTVEPRMKEGEEEGRNIIPSTSSYPSQTAKGDASSSRRFVSNHDDNDIQGYWEHEFQRRSLVEANEQDGATLSTTATTMKKWYDYNGDDDDDDDAKMKTSNEKILKDATTTPGKEKVFPGVRKTQTFPATSDIRTKNSNLASYPKQSAKHHYKDSMGNRISHNELEEYWDFEFGRQEEEEEGEREGKYDLKEQRRRSNPVDGKPQTILIDQQQLPPQRLSSTESSSTPGPTTLAQNTAAARGDNPTNLPGAHPLHGPDYTGESESLFVEKMEGYDQNSSQSRTMTQLREPNTTATRTRNTNAMTNNHANASPTIKPHSQLHEEEEEEEGLATAMAVSDVEPVFYAKDIQHDPTRQRMVRLRCLVLIITIALVGALTFIFTRDPPTDPHMMEEEEDDDEYFADERCRNFTLVERNPALQCRCFNTTDQTLRKFTNATWDLFEVGRQVLVNASVVGQDDLWNLTDCTPRSNAIVTILILSQDVLGLDEGFARRLVSSMPTLFSLLVLYNSLGGLDWFESSGWDLSATDRISPFGVDFFSFQVVTTVALPNNNLIGTIPPDIRLLTSLRRLDLSNNPGLVGTLPSELGFASAIKELYISDTNLEGSVPSSFGGLDRLDVMELRNNALSGTLPPELFTPRLRVLNLSRNRFNGTIPSSISNSSRLQAVLLLDNAFTGTIPGESFGKLSDLELVSFGSNNFTGSIPSEIGTLQFLEFSSYVDSGLSGNVPESFCDTNNTAPRQMVGECTNNNETESVTLECSCCRRSFDLETVVTNRGGVVATCVEELPEFLFDRIF